MDIVIDQSDFSMEICKPLQKENYTDFFYDSLDNNVPYFELMFQLVYVQHKLVNDSIIQKEKQCMNE